MMQREVARGQDSVYTMDGGYNKKDGARAPRRIPVVPRGARKLAAPGAGAGGPVNEVPDVSAPALTPPPAPAPAPAPTPAPARVDSDFNIDTIVRVVPAHMSVATVGNGPDSRPIYNDNSILLECREKYPHRHYCLFKNVAFAKCRSCNPGRRLSGVREAFETYFGAPFCVGDGNDMLCCEGMAIVVATADDKGPPMEIARVCAPSARPYTGIVVRKPFSARAIGAGLRAYALRNLAEFEPAAQEAMARHKRTPFVKEPLPKTRALAATGGNRFLADFDDDVVVDSVAKMLCMENCFCK